MTEYDRWLVGIGEGVSIALDRRVDEHDLGITARVAWQNRTDPSPVTSVAIDNGKSASKFRCRASSRDAQYSVGGRAASGKSD